MYSSILFFSLLKKTKAGLLLGVGTERQLKVGNQAVSVMTVYEVTLLTVTSPVLRLCTSLAAGQDMLSVCGCNCVYD
jgi:hypothetical protein